MNSKIILLVVLSIFVNGLGCGQKPAHADAKQNLRKKIPAYADKVEKTVAPLEKETPTESVSNLYYVNDYFSTGPAIGVVGPDNSDQVDMNEIMSNRRFRKVFSELGKMDKAAASQLVKTNLMSALQSYSGIYEQNMKGMAPFFRVGATNFIGIKNFGGIAFQTGTTKPGDEGMVTLKGEKLKIYSLIWISGMLKLNDNRDLVEEVVRQSLRQKKELDDPTLVQLFKDQMLREASLYNRRILSSGLIGVNFKDAGMESDVMTKAGIQWQQRTLVPYDAALTEFDRPVLSAAMRPDNSKGSFTVNYVSPMADTNFDLLLQEIQFK